MAFASQRQGGRTNKAHDTMKETIAVLGLGYVGLPVALSFSRAGLAVIGYDVNERRIVALKKGHDWTGEADQAELVGTKLQLTSDASAMAAASAALTRLSSIASRLAPQPWQTSLTIAMSGRVYPARARDSPVLTYSRRRG